MTAGVFTQINMGRVRPQPSFEFLHKGTLSALEDDIKEHVLFNFLNPSTLMGQRDVIYQALFKVRQLIDFYQQQQLSFDTRRLLSSVEYFVRIDNRSMYDFTYTVMLKLTDPMGWPTTEYLCKVQNI